MRTNQCLAVLLKVSKEAFKSGGWVEHFWGSFREKLELMNPQTWGGHRRDEGWGVFRVGGSLSPEVSGGLEPTWDGERTSLSSCGQACSVPSEFGDRWPQNKDILGPSPEPFQGSCGSEQLRCGNSSQNIGSQGARAWQPACRQLLVFLPSFPVPRSGRSIVEGCHKRQQRQPGLGGLSQPFPRVTALHCSPAESFDAHKFPL